jgi:hypothetical protein
MHEAVIVPDDPGREDSDHRCVGEIVPPVSPLIGAARVVAVRNPDRAISARQEKDPFVW